MTGDLVYIGGRAHSCNVADLRRAMFVWEMDTEYNPVLHRYFDHCINKAITHVVIRRRRTHEILIEKDFSDVPNINDADVMCLEVATWLNKQFKDYTGKFPNEA